MSPAPDILANRFAGRNVQRGDILIRKSRFDSIPAHIEYYEVLETGVARKRKKFLGLLGEGEIECVKIRELTLYGPAQRTLFIPQSKTETSYWDLDDMILVENRRDPLMRERER